jgi:hypothetical protein
MVIRGGQANGKCATACVDIGFVSPRIDRNPIITALENEPVCCQDPAAVEGKMNFYRSLKFSKKDPFPGPDLISLSRPETALKSSLSRVMEGL